MSTLADLTYQVAQELGVVVEGTATGGTTTTLVDTARTEADDYWNKGTVWIRKDAGGAGAAPEGEFAVVTDFAATSDTMTIGAVTVAVAAGDIYAVAKSRYPLWLLKQKVNEALRKVGPIAITDTTTITTADEQTEYTLPLAATFDLREVWRQTVNDDADDNQWMKLHNWKVQKAGTGSASTLILPQYEAGYKVKLVYVANHPALFATADKLDESIHPDRVVSEAVVGCLMWRMQKTGNADSKLAEQINYFQEQAEQAKGKYPVRNPARTAKLLIVGG